MIIIFSILFIIALVLIQEIVVSTVKTNYDSYAPIKRFMSVWHWVHSSWDFVSLNFNPTSLELTPVRHTGTRWFGFTWEKEIELKL